MIAHTARRLAMLATVLATALTAQAVAGIATHADASARRRGETKPPAATAARFTWRLAGVRTDGNGAVSETNYDSTKESTRSPVTLNACASTAAGGIKTYQWSFSNGDPAISTISCVATWNRPLTETYAQTDVTLTIIPYSGGSASTEHTVRYRDRVIASLGDSAASGEGAPQFGAQPHWAAHYCGRSGWAASAQAALRAQQALPDTTVHFWHLACAGARITAADSALWTSNPRDAGGMLDPYNGTYNHVSPPLKPQVIRLGELKQESGLHVNRLLITIGANELEWAAVARKCLRDVGHQQRCLMGESAKVTDARNVLAAHFDELANAIPDTLVPRDHIYLTGYFDPVDSLSPEPYFCPGELDASQYLRNWAVNNMENWLQDTVKAKALQYRWNYIDGIRQAFQGHGVCQQLGPPLGRWVNSYLESEGTQGDDYGTWHANRTGQLVMASIIYNAIAPGLGQDDSPPPARMQVVLTPDQFKVNTPQTFTVTVTDAVTGAPVPDLTVTVHNFSPQGYPGSFELPEASSPLTATVTFRGGRKFDPATHSWVYDGIPTLDVQAPGYVSQEITPNFPDLP